MAGDINLNNSTMWGDILDRLKQALLGLRRWQKNTILFAVDSTLSVIALFLAYYLRTGVLSAEQYQALLPLFFIVPIVVITIFWALGIYSNLLRAINIKILNSLSIGIGVTAASIAIFGYFNIDALVPRSIPAIFAIIAISLIGSARIAGRWAYRSSVGLNERSQPIVIYGAGETGTHVASVLDNSREFSMLGFIDDDASLWGSRIRGRKIYPHKSLSDFSKIHPELRVLICIAGLQNLDRRKIIEKLSNYPVQVMTIPPLPEVIAGRANLENIKEVSLEDLLGREAVPPIESLFNKAIENKVILVTGGGGSIGYQLCEQIAANSPKKLIIYENSEFALYRAEQNLTDLFPHLVRDNIINFVLGSVTDKNAVEMAFSEFKPEIVYHAAAYKHVPIVENNPVQGLRNNVLGTFNVAACADKHKCERFILVSTDKAVRPTNVMGATKRFAELVVQGFGSTKTNTVFSMVRFGNVLGSSGSVIPLFRKQIASGGPITLTHKNVTRYFMTIKEASQLVIQAGSVSKGGEVFLLDMGEPVRIEQLARLMIQLSGKTFRDKDNPSGEIEIQYTGLRPGEKLYEELLISENAAGTLHPKIMKAQENSLSFIDIKKHISNLEKIVERNLANEGIEMLKLLVDGYKGDVKNTSSNTKT